MKQTGSEAADWLERHADGIAAAVTRVQFGADSEHLARYGPRGRQRCFEDNKTHLSYLLQAVAADEPVLFRDYVAWARILLENLGIPRGDLYANLGLLREEVRARADASLRPALLGPLTSVLEGFDALPSHLETHIGPEQPHAELAGRYLELLLAAQRREASELVLAAVDGGMPIRDVYLHVFQAVQYEVGRLWQINRISVAQEHFCTAATQMVMSLLYPRLFTTERNGLSMVAACVSGDLHEIGARILSDFFEMSGWDTFYVGANTPTEGLVQAVLDESADLVALSATMVAHVPRVRATIAALREAAPQVPIMVGGYPFRQAPLLYQKVGADGTAVNADEAVVRAARLVEDRR